MEDNVKETKKRGEERGVRERKRETGRNRSSRQVPTQTLTATIAKHTQTGTYPYDTCSRNTSHSLPAPVHPPL